MMKQFFKPVFYSFPVQLVLLHFKKFQVLLLFWLALFGAVNSSFMSAFGMDSLFLAPEYLGEVNSLSAALVGIAIGIFIMSWNITTFILFSRHFKFLATTTRPFLKYCINNFIIPLSFLIFYFIKAFIFDKSKELLTTGEILLLSGGFLCGLILIVVISFLYFFRADITITRRMIAVTDAPSMLPRGFRPQHIVLNSGGSRLIKVTSYLNSPFSAKPVRAVSHYSSEFLEMIFSRHHFAAVLSIVIAFVFLITVGFFMDHRIFQLPAASSITIFFAILMAVAGAFSYFLQSWSVPFMVLLLLGLNFLFRHKVIDPTNKAYGLNYSNQKERTGYNRESLLDLCTPAKVERDKKYMIETLGKWKQKQKEAKPYLYIISVSGGGTRSATFTFNILQRLDSLSGGKIMDQTFLISGASGGMLGASYFRELFAQKTKGAPIHLQDKKYAANISKDLLNPTFSSFVARDLASPAQKFTVGEYAYVKDRGYAFEQKLNENTGYVMNRQLKDIQEDENSARVPLIFFNSVVTRDGRKMVLSTQPVSFMMKPAYDSTMLGEMDPDAIDFGAMFAHQDPMNIRLLTALRMNCTFPYVLPNVWLPSSPVIDVMDAGLRDNYGLETALRFTNVFSDWIKANTNGVVIIQIRDRKSGGWEFPFESDNISEIITKPLLLLQYNWYKMQQYNQNDLVAAASNVMDSSLRKISFEYVPSKEDKAATLNFHLTNREKQDIRETVGNSFNSASFKTYQQLQSP